MLFLDTIGCTESSDGIWIARRDGVLFVQVLQTSSVDNRLEHDLLSASRTSIKCPGLRDSFCYWSHPSVVGTPGTECGACIALLIAGIPTKEVEKDIGLTEIEIRRLNE